MNIQTSGYPHTARRSRAGNTNGQIKDAGKWDPKGTKGTPNDVPGEQFGAPTVANQGALQLATVGVARKGAISRPTAAQMDTNIRPGARFWSQCEGQSR